MTNEVLFCILLTSATINLLALLQVLLSVLVARCRCRRVRHLCSSETICRIVLMHIPTCALLVIIIYIFLTTPFFTSPLLYWSALLSYCLATRLGWQLFHIVRRLSDVVTLKSHKLELYNLVLACICTAFIFVTQQSGILAFYLVLLDFLYMFTDCSALLTIKVSNKQEASASNMSLCVAFASLTFTLLIQGVLFVATVVLTMVNGKPSSLARVSLPMFAFFCIYYTCSNFISIVICIRNVIRLKVSPRDGSAMIQELEWVRKVSNTSDKSDLSKPPALTKVLNNNANVNVSSRDKTAYKHLVLHQMSTKGDGVASAKGDGVASVSEQFASDQQQRLVHGTGSENSERRAGDTRSGEAVAIIGEIGEGREMKGLRLERTRSLAAMVTTDRGKKESEHSSIPANRKDYAHLDHEQARASNRLGKVRKLRQLRLTMAELSPIEEESS